MILEQLIAKSGGMSVRSARLAILAGDVLLNDSAVRTTSLPVSRFDRIHLGNQLLQSGEKRLYLMMHKPIGILSATSDDVHATVLDVIDRPDASSLHLAGRLDRSSSGLVLLTNDGNWSESLTLPERKVSKEYLVDTDREIPKTAVEAFRRGFAFEPEGIITKPSQLEILGPQKARVILHEGRYHQIKRMFHRLDGIRLTSLHRVRIGEIVLPAELKSGEWRELTAEEVASVSSTSIPARAEEAP